MEISQLVGYPRMPRLVPRLLKGAAACALVLLALAHAMALKAEQIPHETSAPPPKIAMTDTDAQAADPKVQIEKDKLALDREKFAYQREADAQKLAADKVNRKWSQAAVIIPILVVLFSISANYMNDRSRAHAAAQAEQKKVRTAFIWRQLSELYYPLQEHFAKDTAVWTLSKRLTQGDASSREEINFSNSVENDILLPNHIEAIGIIDKHYDLVTNPEEPYDATELFTQIGNYQRHVAVYMALRKSNLPNNPIDKEAFPKRLPTLVLERIQSLKQQLDALKAA